MKTLALVLSTIILTILIFGAGLGIVFMLDDDDRGVLYLALAPIFVFTYGPLIVGSMRTYFDPSRSPEGRRYFQRVFWVIVGLDVLSAAAVVAFTAITNVSWWLPVATIVAAVALLAAAIFVGDALRRRDDRLEPAEPVWQPFDRSRIRRKIVTVAITFVVASVATILLFGVWAQNDSGRSDSWAAAIGYGFALGFFASGFACVIVALPIARALRGSLNKDVGRAQKFARLILRRKDIDLTEEEQAPAARYASLLAVSLAFNLAYISLLYAGIFLQNLIVYLRNPADLAFNGMLTLGLIVLYLIILPITIRRIRRARKYASDHADLLPEAVAA